MIVIYAEKQSMGIKFATALGGVAVGSRLVNMDSLTTYNKEVKDMANAQGYLKTGYNGKDYIVTWGWGHFGTLKDAKDYNPTYKNWSAMPLPFFPQKYEVKAIVTDNEFFQKRNEKQLAIVTNLFNDPSCEYIINATDWEREGELIFCYTYQLTGSNKTYYRAHINKQTEKEIRKGFNNMIPSKDIQKEEHAARCRAIADWTLGINLTVAATLNLSSDKMLSIGRLITPTLNMIVEREKAINAFSITNFYTIQGEFITVNGQTYTGKYINERIESQTEAEDIARKVPTDGEIIILETKRKKQFAPKPFSLASLQKEANKKYGFTAKETLDIAQKLYEGGTSGGYITYPRTSSEYLTSDCANEMESLIKKLGTINKYKQYLACIPFPIKVSGSYFNDAKVEGHSAIITTEVLPTNLPDDQGKIYDMIVKSVIRLAFPPVEYDNTVLETKAGTELFRTKGTVVVEPGWTIVDADKDLKNDIPNGIRLNDSVKGQYTVAEGKTEPPKRFNDATLIEAMENCGKKEEDAEIKKILTDIEGIGRASTRDACIERLISYKYIQREKKNIVPTELGIGLIDTLPLDSLKSPELTAQWEMELDKISIGEHDVPSFVKDIQDKTKEWCQMIANAKTILAAPKDETKWSCPKCEGQLTQSKYGYICGSGCGFKLYTKMYEHELNEKEINELLTMKRTRLIKGLTSKDGKKFNAYFIINEELKVTISFDSIWICPKCGKPLRPSKFGYGCSGYKETGCNFSLLTEYGGKKIKNRDIQNLLKMEPTEIIEGFLSQKGTLFNAYLFLNEEYKVIFGYENQVYVSQELEKEENHV